MRNYKSYTMIANIKYTLLAFFNKNKTKIILFGCVFLISLLTGIFTSIKIYSLEKDFDFTKYSMYTLVAGDVYGLGAFFLRVVSLSIIAVLLCLFSINGFLSLFGYVLIAYRFFLIGMNCSLIIIRFGLSGVLNSILIIFPCQLLMTLILMLFFVHIRNKIVESKKCGSSNKGIYRIFGYFVVLFFVISFVEYLLLLIFKPTTILII